MAFDALRIILEAVRDAWFPAYRGPFRPPCPYCRERLPEIPTRTIRCCWCGHRVHVRGGSCRTDYDARALDILKSLGWSEGTALRHLDPSSGRPCSLNDFAREALDERILSRHPRPSRARLFYDRARVAAADGHDPASLLRESWRVTLFDWWRFLPRDAIVVVSTPLGACAACRALEGRRLRLDDALVENVVPVAGCTTRRFEACRRPWCRCFYSLA